MSENTGILSANLAALARFEPAFAARLSCVDPAPLDWSASRTGPPTATLLRDGRTLSLASRFDPQSEAAKLLESVDLGKHACVVMLGFGLGYHIARLAPRIGEDAILIVFEPDLPLLRAVLERIDHSQWLGHSQLILADETTDRAALLNRIEKQAALLTQGTVLVTHPPSRQISGEKFNAFGKLVAEVTAFARTNVATALVNSTRTYRNLTANLAPYVGGATTDELFGAAAGYPAICVSAGPSLAKNVELLCDPQVRRNVVVITAQTTLKPLLDRGIRPDFVTALDYHEISRRFYEGLPALPDVTLVAEPKANPTIVESFPGPVRMTQSRFLDRLLGPLARPRINIRDGATVAHLSFYLAQHLGCNPILLIGQDLGFSDGLYYCPGTAIHEVWAPELGPFNTLEMMEWQRIVRHRRHLHKCEDIHGRPIYSDEQMITYLKQFERDFSTASQTVLDCTEGGMPKKGASLATLADALAEHATRPVPPMPAVTAKLDPGKVRAAEELLRQRIEEVRELDRLADDTIPALRQMGEHQRDFVRVEKLFARVERNKKKVEALSDAFNLVNDLNTIGVFRRVRADRAIQHDSASESDPYEKQRRQIQRDIENIEWLRQAYSETLNILEGGLERVQQHGKPVSIPLPKRVGSPSHTAA